MRAAPMRSKSTFVPLEEYKKSGWAAEAKGLGKEKVRQQNPVEIAVRCHIPNIQDYIIDAKHLD